MRYQKGLGNFAWTRIILPPILAILVFCGCESSISVKTPVSEADFKALGKTGDSTVSGQIPRYSSVPVHLDPATPYTDALVRALTRHGKFATLNEDDTAIFEPIMLEHRRTAVADSDGAYSFAHVAPGRYYIAWYDTWMEQSTEIANRDPNPPAGIHVSHEFDFKSPRGEWHFKKITVRAGESLPDVDFD